MKSDKNSILDSFLGRTYRAAVPILILAFTAVLSACGGGGSEYSKNAVGRQKGSTARTEATHAGETVSKTGQPEKDAASDVTVVPTAASTLTLVDEDTEAFTMQIPKGWEIRYGWDGEKLLMVRVYDPENPVNQIFYATDMLPFMKNDKEARSFAIYGWKIFSEAPVLDPPTNENLFQQIPKIRKYYKDIMNLEAGAAMIPEIYDFKLLETMSAASAYKEDSHDDSIIYGTFRNEDGSAEGEGIGFASIEDIFDPAISIMFGSDIPCYRVYAFTALTSVKDEFVNYEEILCRSVSSLTLKQDFVAKTLENSEDSFAKMREANASISAMYDSYNAAWRNRSQSSDIARQKGSDATLGYERVYDTETGEIYKAYNGFTDTYQGKRYKPVSDSMYSQGWSGFIEK